MPTGGGAPSTSPGPLDDLNVETPALHLEPMLGSNSTVSNVHIVLYSLFNTFHQLSRGAPLFSPRLPYDRFHYGFTSTVDVYAWLERMLTLPPLTSEFMGMVGYAPASFHNLIDDEVDSDGSSISDVAAPGHPLSWECAMADAPR